MDDGDTKRKEGEEGRLKMQQGCWDHFWVFFLVVVVGLCAEFVLIRYSSEKIKAM